MATPAHTTQTWRFGVFEVDAQKEELRRAGVPIKMREQPLRILIFLLEHAGEIVTREELRRVLWPADTFVDFDHSLNTAVMKLRETLGDTADKPLYIETVPKRGYRFIAPVSLATDLQNNNAGSSVDSAVPRTSGETEVPQAAGATAQVPLRRPRIERIAGAVVGMVLLVGAGILVYIRAVHVAAPAKDSDSTSSSFQIVPVTSAPGVDGDPAISPDGREIAYTWDSAGLRRPEVYVLRIGSETPLRITDGGGDLGGPTWSPDGDVIAFTRCEGKEGAVYLVPALGGPERRLTSTECQYNRPSPLAWTRDGGRILMIDRCSANGPFGLVLFSLETGEKRCLPDVGPIDFRGFGFSLSPDGGTVAFTRSSGLCEVYTIPISGGAPHRLMKDDHPCGPPMWTPDGKSIVFWSSRTTLPSLWRVMATGGEMQRETLYPALGSFSKDGRRFVYADSITNEPPSIWRTDLENAGGHVLTNRKLISTQYGELDAQPSPDGSRIVWMSGRTGSYEIWASDATGENPLQLTHLGRFSGTPRWSPDGKWIAFDSYKSEEPQIFVVDSEGRNLRAITASPYPSVVPSWSRDGKWIYFASDRTGTMEVWKHSLKDGQELQITKHGGFDPFESHDGQTVYFSKFDEAGIWSVPSQGGTESLVVAGKPQVRYWGHWAITRTGLYLLGAEAERSSRIEFYDFETRRIVPVLTLEKPAVRLQPSLSATADGKTIYHTQFDYQSVIKMMEFSK